MQTVMEELISQLDLAISLCPREPNVSESAMYQAYVNCRDWAILKLRTEKKELMNAFKEGHDNCGEITSVEFYNKTYYSRDKRVF